MDRLGRLSLTSQRNEMFACGDAFETSTPTTFDLSTSAFTRPGSEPWPRLLDVHDVFGPRQETRTARSCSRAVTVFNINSRLWVGTPVSGGTWKHFDGDPDRHECSRWRRRLLRLREMELGVEPRGVRTLTDASPTRSKVDRRRTVTRDRSFREGSRRPWFEFSPRARCVSAACGRSPEPSRPSEPRRHGRERQRRGAAGLARWLASRGRPACGGSDQNYGLFGAGVVDAARTRRVPHVASRSDCP